MAPFFCLIVSFGKCSAVFDVLYFTLLCCEYLLQLVNRNFVFQCVFSSPEGVSNLICYFLCLVAHDFDCFMWGLKNSLKKLPNPICVLATF